jgi:alkaline phosphatase
MRYHPFETACGLWLATALALPSTALSLAAQTTLRIVPADGSVFAVGQRFDLRVEATGGDPDGPAPRGLRVQVDGRDLTDLNILDVGEGGERGAGGTGSTGAEVPTHQRASRAPAHTTNFLARDRRFDVPGTYTIRARTEDGAEAEVTVRVEAWRAQRPDATRVRNVILLLGDGMGVANRTAARVVSHGVTEGRSNGLLAMDRMEATGLVMTYSFNSIITDSAPGMSALSTGHKSNNNQVGVYPDNTLGDPFDNPRVEYIGELLRRERGEGFRVGLVTTADVADATPAGNAVHTASRDALPLIAARYLDERDANGVSVLLGGGSRHFRPGSDEGSSRSDERDLLAEFTAAGYHHLATATELNDLLAAGQVPDRLLGLFHSGHMNVAFDKVGAGRYSDELADEAYEGLRDQPVLADMTRLALRSLESHAPDGFYLMVEGASIDKQAHAVDAERTIWDTIEFDHAVAAALEFAERTNTDDDPDNETLVLVASDHETGGFAMVAVGNERYAPTTLDRAVRDYAAVFRFQTDQVLDFFPNYEVDATGFPVDPDPERKLLLGWAASPDRYENWLSNRRAGAPATYERRAGAPAGAPQAGAVMAVPDPARDGPDPDGDNRSVDGRPVAGFLVEGIIENGAEGCPAEDACPADTRALPLTISGHTASDVPISASGPGAFLFTGTFDNTEVFLKMLRVVGGDHEFVGRSSGAGAGGVDDA